MKFGKSSVNKVLHLINGEHYAGAERVQDLLSVNLSAFHYEPHFACLKPGIFPHRASTPIEQVHLFPMRGRLDFTVLKDLSAFISREKFSLVHTHTPRTAMIGALLALRHGLPFVHHQHSPSTRESVGGVRDKLGALLEAFAVRRASRIIAVSKQIEEYCSEMGFSGDRIRLVHNGVPPSTIPHKGVASGGVIRLAVVALFRERKGLEVAIEAIARCIHRVELEIIGDFVSKEYEAKMHFLVNKLGLQKRVHWRGPTDDIYSALAKVDGFILPSLYGEGLPMVLLEAMAAGLVIFAAEVEGVAEAIPDASVGNVFPAGDVAALAELISVYAADGLKFAKSAAAAKARHLAYFSDQAMAERVASVYDSVLSPSYSPTGA